MVMILKILKWLASGGLDRITDALTVLWSLFEELSDLLGIRKSSEASPKRQEASAIVGEIRAAKEGRS